MMKLSLKTISIVFVSTEWISFFFGFVCLFCFTKYCFVTVFIEERSLIYLKI